MKKLLDIFHFVVESKITTLAGSLCFFLLLNGGSYIFLIVSITSFIIDYETIINSLLNDGLIKDLLVYLFKHSSSIQFNIILILTSIYSSSSLYYHFIQAGEVITDYKIDYKYSKRIISVILAFIVIFILFVLSILISILPFLFSNRLILYLIAITLFILIIYILNKLILKTSFKNIKFGLLFTVIYSCIFTFGFVIYLSFFSFKIVYGYLAVIIIFLFYLYVIMIGILLGIKLNWKKVEA